MIMNLDRRTYRKPVILGSLPSSAAHVLAGGVTEYKEAMTEVITRELRLRAKIADDQVRSIEEARRRPIQNIRFTV